MLIGLLFSVAICFPSAAAAENAQFAPLEKQISDELKKWQIPGAAICISKNGKILMNRGFGYADPEKKIATRPDSVFRIGSLSKSLTAIAVLMLCQDGQLSLDQPAFPLLKCRPVNPQMMPDARLSSITIRQLLTCSAGWLEEGLDPVFGEYAREAAFYSPSLRPTADALVRNWMSRPLDFEPGNRFAYSNLSYVVLGLIVEAIAKEPYDRYVSQKVLLPLKMFHTQPGKTPEQLPGEVRYYSMDGAAESLLPNLKGNVSMSYGGNFYMEGMTASAGWTSTVQDLVKLGNELNLDRPSAILEKQWKQTMLARPDYVSPIGEREYFAMGWEVDQDERGKRTRFSRHGSLSGTMALISCRKNGIVWAAAFNSRPVDYVTCREEIKSCIENYLDKIK